MPDHHPVCIECISQERRDEARELSERFDIPLSPGSGEPGALLLRLKDEHIDLYDPGLGTSIFVDFVEGALAHRERYGGGKGQAIAKAVGLKTLESPTILDITAGLARDAFILASLGCRLTLVERSPVLFTLIRDGIGRALDADPDNSANRITNLVCSDSRLFMEHMDTEIRPDVIYMDPMYPERKKSAMVKKDMQILHRLIGHPEDDVALLETARSYAEKRVVVKRPTSAPPLGPNPPSTSVSSKKTRYDIYLPGGSG